MSASEQNPQTATLSSIGDLVTAIDHVGIAVPDLEVAKSWYLDNLGLVCLHQETNAAQGVVEAMVGPAGADKSHALIQLLSPIDETSTIAKFIDRNGPGLQQMAVRVTDVEEVTRRLVANGVRVLYDGPRHGTANSRINFIHPKDAGGVLLELVEPAATPH